MQRGRRIAAQLSQVADVDKLSQVEQDLAGRAIGLIDILGLYIDKGYVDRELPLTEWAYSLDPMRPGIERYRKWRLRLHGFEPWPHASRLLCDASAWVDERRYTGGK